MPSSQQFSNLAHSSPGNALNMSLEQELWQDHKLNFLMSFTETASDGKSYKFMTNGNEEVKTNTMNAMNIHEVELKQNDDTSLVPFKNKMDENFVQGNESTEGKAISRELSWKQLYRSTVRERLNLWTGKHAKQTNKEIMDQLIDDAKPDLTQSFDGHVEHHGFYSSLNRGVGKNILNLSATFGGIVQRSHPNFFYKVTGTGKLTQVAGVLGTDAYEDNVGTALNQHVDASNELIDHKFFLDLKIFCLLNKITPIYTAMGATLWIVVTHPEVVNQIRSLQIFTDSLQQAQAREPNNPIFINATAMFEGFVFYEDIWSWAVDLETPGTAHDKVTNPLIYGVEKPLVNFDLRNLKMSFVLGQGALIGARVRSLTFETEFKDGKNIADLIGDIDYGIARSDLYGDPNTNLKFGKGTFYGNFSSLAFVINIDAA